MKRNEHGGFTSRMMPPDNWNHGEIPRECFDKSLSEKQILDILVPVYTRDENIKRLSDGDDAQELFIVRTAVEMVAEIDARTIYRANQSGIVITDEKSIGDPQTA